MKKGVKRTIETIILVIIIAIALLLIGFGLYGEQIIKSQIEKAGTQALQVKVDIGNLDLAVLKGAVTIGKIEIANPQGYEQDYLLQVGNTDIKTQLKSLMKDTVIIDHILLDDITVAIEQKGLNNNLQEVLGNLPKSEGQDKEGKQLRIKELKITNTTVKVKLLPVQIMPQKADTVELKLEPILLNDLGSDDKMTTARLTKAVLAAISEAIAKQGAGILPDDVLGSIQGKLKNIGDITNILEEKGGGLLKSGGKDVQESGEGLIEGVKGIFDKKEDTQD